ncbi:MFS transporter [Nonomuraea sp. NPDC002799]
MVITRRPAPWRRLAVLGALMLAALTFNTAENLPVGLLKLMSEDLRVSLSAVGLLVTGYGVTVAIASVPIAHVVRAVPRRHVLTGLLAALVVSSLIAAPAPSYWLLLVARLLTALAQALFWAVMGPVAVGLFAPEVRGRVVGALSVAGSLALVFGVPAGTWLGRQSAWQVPLAMLAALGLVCLVTIAVLLPTSRPEEEPAAYATSPDTRRFGTVLAAGTLSATGAFAGYTYIVTFLGDVSGFSPSAVSVLFVVFGVACLAGVSRHRGRCRDGGTHSAARRRTDHLPRRRAADRRVLRGPARRPAAAWAPPHMVILSRRPGRQPVSVSGLTRSA